MATKNNKDTIVVDSADILATILGPTIVLHALVQIMTRVDKGLFPAIDLGLSVQLICGFALMGFALARLGSYLSRTEKK